MFVDKGLSDDPDKKKWVMGWGVVQSDPWCLIGIYATKQMAEQVAAQMGEGYEAHYGSHKIGSCDFMR